jgi:hypothetical protein
MMVCRRAVRKPKTIIRIAHTDLAAIDRARYALHLEKRAKAV